MPPLRGPQRLGDASTGVALLALTVTLCVEV